MSHEQNSADDGLKELEVALGFLAPARSGIDRDRVMFEAGRASRRGGGVAHQSLLLLSTVLALISLGEGAAILHLSARPETSNPVAKRPVEPAAEEPAKLVNAAEASRTEPEFQDASWPTFAEGTPRDRLTAQVLRYGLDGLPGPLPAAGGEGNSRTLQSHRPLPEEILKELELGGPS